MRERDCVRVFVLVQKCVECYQNLHSVQMRITNHFLQVFKTVSRSLSCTIRRRTDIDGIRPCLNGCTGYSFVPCRREEAKRYMTIPAVTLTFMECLVPY